MSGNVKGAEGTVRLTRDDDRARRICSLALDFMNASSPLRSSEIARAHYPGLSADSFRRAFSRDRSVLAACGVVVAERRVPGEDSLWEADHARSFARGAELSATEAAALELACRPLADDPTFPLADDLRLALAKVSRAFSETLAVGRARDLAPSRILETLCACLTDQTAALATYVDARGRASERTLAPYGFFGLRGNLYLVAARVSDDGSTCENQTRTYRIDRFTAAKALKGTSFSIPEDFSVADWRRLPFQMGATACEARFLVDGDRLEEVRRAAGSQSSFEQVGSGAVWAVDVSDVSAAASWAVAMGIRPIAPEPLVAAWRGILEGVTHDVG